MNVALVQLCSAIQSKATAMPRSSGFSMTRATQMRDLLGIGGAIASLVISRASWPLPLAALAALAA